MCPILRIHKYDFLKGSFCGAQLNVCLLGAMSLITEKIRLLLTYSQQKQRIVCNWKPNLGFINFDRKSTIKLSFSFRMSYIQAPFGYFLGMLGVPYCPSAPCPPYLTKIDLDVSFYKSKLDLFENIEYQYGLLTRKKNVVANTFWQTVWPSIKYVLGKNAYKCLLL